MGNAAQLSARSKMWESIIEQLSDENAIGGGFPLMCSRHPGNINYVSQPGEIKNVSPDGESQLMRC